jgi:hypothetical protein
VFLTLEKRIDFLEGFALCLDPVDRLQTSANESRKEQETYYQPGDDDVP